MKQILITRLRFMGDVILTMPLLQSIREKYPRARIIYLTEAPFHQLLEGHPAVDDVWVLRKGMGKQIQLISQLILTHFDAAIDLFGNPRSALLMYLSGAKIRIGGDFRGRRLLYTHRIQDDNRTLNAIEYHMRYGHPIGIRSPYRAPVVSVTRNEKAWASRYLRRSGYALNRPIVGMHIGATWPAKRWLPERFAELADRVQRELKADVFFTAGPGEAEEVQAVISQCDCRISTPQVLSLRKLSAVLSHLTVFVSNDCGPVHLAPAVGTPTIGIFGPGEPEIWFPYASEQGHRAIHHPLDCSRCHRDFCEKLDCMRSIRVQEVLEAVQTALHLHPKIR